MNLNLKIKNVYGVDRYYPACPVSRAICEIKKTPTMLPRDVTILRTVGFSFTIYGEEK